MEQFCIGVRPGQIHSAARLMFSRLSFCKLYVTLVQRQPDKPVGTAKAENGKMSHRRLLHFSGDAPKTHWCRVFPLETQWKRG